MVEEIEDGRDLRITNLLFKDILKILNYINKSKIDLKGSEINIAQEDC